MYAFTILAPFWLVWLLAVITPGPNFFAVTHMAAARGRRAGLLAASGVALGAVVWALAGLFGLQLFFAAFPWARSIIKLCGALYLIYVGMRMWRQASACYYNEAFHSHAAFRLGLLTNLSNPKTAALAASLFAVAVPAGAPSWMTVAAFCLIVFTAWGWYSLCALVASQAVITKLYQRAKSLLMRVAGLAFAGFGLKLAFDP